MQGMQSNDVHTQSRDTGGGVTALNTLFDVSIITNYYYLISAQCTYVQCTMYSCTVWCVRSLLNNTISAFIVFFAQMNHTSYAIVNNLRDDCFENLLAKACSATAWIILTVDIHDDCTNIFKTRKERFDKLKTHSNCLPHIHTIRSCEIVRVCIAIKHKKEKTILCDSIDNSKE